MHAASLLSISNKNQQAQRLANTRLTCWPDLYRGTWCIFCIREKEYGAPVHVCNLSRGCMLLHFRQCLELQRSYTWHSRVLHELIIRIRGTRKTLTASSSCFNKIISSAGPISHVSCLEDTYICIWTQTAHLCLAEVLFWRSAAHPYTARVLLLSTQTSAEAGTPHFHPDFAPFTASLSESGPI